MQETGPVLGGPALFLLNSHRGERQRAIRRLFPRVLCLDSWGRFTTGQADRAAGEFRHEGVELLVAVTRPVDEAGQVLAQGSFRAALLLSSFLILNFLPEPPADPIFARQSTTLAPRSPSMTAVASPIPLLTPVMTTTLSLIPGMKFFFPHQGAVVVKFAAPSRLPCRNPRLALFTADHRKLNILRPTSRRREQESIAADFRHRHLELVARPFLDRSLVELLPDQLPIANEEIA